MNRRHRHAVPGGGDGPAPAGARLTRRAVVGASAAAAASVVLPGCAGPKAPPDGAAGLVPQGPLQRFAFGSCLDQHKPQPVWEPVLADRPELFVFGGDNVYASTRPWDVRNLRQAYRRLEQVPGFAQLRRTTPQLAIWDDHDYGSNDAGAEFAGKHASKDVFLDFWRVPADDPRRTRDGLYHALAIGPPGRRVQFIVLDCRWFRSPLRASDTPMAPGKERYLPDDDPSKTMLGELQWAWLAQQLRQPAELRFVVSGVQVLAEGHGWECWGNLPHERRRLVELIAASRARGVVFLSGDRHIGAFYRHVRAGAYPLTEMTASGMTHAWAQAREAGPNRLGELVTDNHYALVDIDWAAGTVRLALKGVDGRVVQAQTLSLAELTA